jgi:hypothetical protein
MRLPVDDREAGRAPRGRAHRVSRMRARRLPRDAELLQAIQQRRASEAEARRSAMGPADHLFGVLQDLEDVLAFNLFEGSDSGR